MITRLSFTGGSDRTVPANIRGKLSVIVSALADRLTWWMLRLQQKIQADKLQGQVLQHRSGRLTGSINAKPTEQEGVRLIGSVEGAGGPAWYGQLHETGGTFNVKEHLRRTGFNRKGEVVKLLNHSGSVRASVASTQAGLVKAHTVTFPARPFMSSALEEMSSEMVADLEQTVGISVK